MATATAETLNHRWVNVASGCNTDLSVMFSYKLNMDLVKRTVMPASDIGCNLNLVSYPS